VTGATQRVTASGGPSCRLSPGEGVYDDRQLNDRLLLGLKGTLSEAELGWIRQRAHEALLAKARRGALILGLTVG
jgi:DNA invertase Pin-like site-specific DNA recombinase